MFKRLLWKSFCFTYRNLIQSSEFTKVVNKVNMQPNIEHSSDEFDLTTPVAEQDPSATETSYVELLSRMGSDKPRWKYIVQTWRNDT